MNAPELTLTGDRVDTLVQHELHRLHQQWWCFLLLGVALLICGVVAMGYPLLITASAVAVVGAMLFVSGVATIISSFWTGQWSAFLLQMLVGVLYVVVGLAVIDKPFATAGVLTLFVGAFAIITGLVRVIAAMTIRFPQWGWALLNGAVTALFGVLIYRLVARDPASILWVIGLLVGVELMLNGWTWTMLALQLRKLGRSDAPLASSR